MIISEKRKATGIRIVRGIQLIDVIAGIAIGWLEFRNHRYPEGVILDALFIAVIIFGSWRIRWLKKR